MEPEAHVPSQKELDKKKASDALSEMILKSQSQRGVDKWWHSSILDRENDGKVTEVEGDDNDEPLPPFEQVGDLVKRSQSQAAKKQKVSADSSRTEDTINMNDL